MKRGEDAPDVRRWTGAEELPLSVNEEARAFTLDQWMNLLQNERCCCAMDSSAAVLRVRFRCCGFFYVGALLGRVDQVSWEWMEQRFELLSQENSAQSVGRHVAFKLILAVEESGSIEVKTRLFSRVLPFFPLFFFFFWLWKPKVHEHKGIFVVIELERQAKAQFCNLKYHDRAIAATPAFVFAASRFDAVWIQHQLRTPRIRLEVRKSPV
ncbi:hypothetical protein IWX49DRAFT_267797 [Phyllosticta citricarpa]